MDLSTLTLTELRDALRRGETTSVAATTAMIDRIVTYDNALRSYLTVADESALEQAAGGIPGAVQAAVDAALQQQAVAILVFPSITKAGTDCTPKLSASATRLESWPRCTTSTA